MSLARDRGFDGPSAKAGQIVEWLTKDCGLGRGHATALVHVIKNGAEISDKHVGPSGTHRDESDTLWLYGVKNRSLSKRSIACSTYAGSSYIS